MMEGKSIGLFIFTVLNALGVAFLLYVLVQFWNEGHRSEGANRRVRRLSAYGARPKVVIVTAPITSEALHEDGRVVRFPVRVRNEQQHGDGNDLPGRTSKTSRSVAW